MLVNVMISREKNLTRMLTLKCYDHVASFPGLPDLFNVENSSYNNIISRLMISVTISSDVIDKSI